MKNNISYLIKEGFKNIWANRFMSFASVGVLATCILLVGSAILTYMNIQQGIKYVGSLGEISIFLNDNVTTDQIGQISITLNSMPELYDINYISSADALNQMKQQVPNGDQLFSMLGTNVLPDTFKVKVRDASQYQQMVTKVSHISGVSQVVSNGKVASTLATLSKNVALFGSAMVALLLAVSIFILINTIKLTMYSRRREIYIMKMVGATNFFVRVPFFVEGATIGLAASFVSFFIIRFAYVGIENYLMTIGIHPLIWAVISLKVFFIFLIVGFATGLFSSSVSMMKYLRV